MTQTLVAIGTRKGLWLARSNDRTRWTLDGPHHLMREVPSIAIDTRGGQPRLLVGFRSEHWGPTIVRSDDLGQSWDETPEGAIRFPEDSGAAVERVWQITPDVHDDDVVWASTEPQALWRSGDRGESFSLVRGLWEHPHRTQWGAGFGGRGSHDPARSSRRRRHARRHEHGRRLSDRGRRRVVDGQQQWDQGAVPARPVAGVRPVRAQGGP